jgi:hypothetical protein
VITQRILAVLSAALLVGAVALAMLGPPEVPLGQVLFMINHDLMEAVHGFVGTHLASWLWDYLLVPVLVRPAWLMPATVGLIFGGASLSLSTRKPARRSHRRS